VLRAELEHEMYSGGHAYFDVTLPRFGQEPSYFNLHNDRWQLMELDSGHDDHGLRDPQNEWLTAQLAIGGRRNILLTHHQLFSPFEVRGNGRTLDEKVALLLPNAFAWCWGHEHKAIVFADHRGIKARCIGHGTIPTMVPYGTPQFSDMPIHWIDERPAPDGTEALHGFALLRFHNSALDVSYVDEFGATWFEESFQSREDDLRLHYFFRFNRDRNSSNTGGIAPRTDIRTRSTAATTNDPSGRVSFAATLGADITLGSATAICCWRVGSMVHKEDAVRANWRFSV
jgi:hypothetical protein